MNFSVIKGRTISVDSKDVLVKEIEKIVSPDGSSTYYLINNETKISRFDLAIAISIAESEVNKNRLGLFIRKTKTLLKRDIKYQSTFGLRTYGYNKCGIFFELLLGDYDIALEFCWKEKDVYEKGELPDRNLEYRKVF